MIPLWITFTTPSVWWGFLRSHSPGSTSCGFWDLTRLNMLWLGADLAVAHGSWSSAAHSRYERFKMSEVLSVPSAPAGLLPDAPDAGVGGAPVRASLLEVVPAQLAAAAARTSRGGSAPPACRRGAAPSVPGPASASGVESVPSGSSPVRSARLRSVACQPRRVQQVRVPSCFWWERFSLSVFLVLGAVLHPCLFVPNGCAGCLRARALPRAEP